MTPQIFNYEKNQIRTILINSISWFVAKDICNALDIRDTSQAVDKLDEDEKLIRKLYVSGQQRDTWTVNEFGLYSLILTSNKPEAKQFKKWITHEILPSIRKAGIYTTKEQKELSIENQKIIKKRREHQATIKAYRSNIKDLKSKIDTLTEKLEENIVNPDLQKKLL